MLSARETLERCANEKEALWTAIFGPKGQEKSVGVNKDSSISSIFGEIEG